MLQERDLNRPVAKTRHEKGRDLGPRSNATSAKPFDLKKCIRLLVTSKNVDWTLTVDLVDRIRDGDRKISNEVLNELRTHIRSYNSNVDYCLNALLVLDALVKNSTLMFHAELATVKWMQLLSKVARQSKDSRITTQIHQMFSDWRHAFGDSTQLRQFSLVCTQLETHGVLLPTPEPIVFLPSPVPVGGNGVSGLPADSIVSPVQGGPPRSPVIDLCDSPQRCFIDLCDDSTKENAMTQSLAPPPSFNSRLSFPYSPQDYLAAPSPVDPNMFAVHYSEEQDGAAPQSVARDPRVARAAAEDVGTPDAVKRIRSQMALITRFRFPSKDREGPLVSRTQASLAVRHCRQWLDKTAETTDPMVTASRRELSALLALVGDIQACKGPAEMEYNKLVARELDISATGPTPIETPSAPAHRQPKFQPMVDVAAPSSIMTIDHTDTTAAEAEQHLRSEISSLKAELEQARSTAKDMGVNMQTASDERSEQLKHLKQRCQTIAGSVDNLREEATTSLTVFADNFNLVSEQISSQLASYFEGTAELKEQNRILTQRYHSEVARRKKVHNQLQELKGNIRVVCRVRPLLSSEGENGVVDFDQFNDDEISIINPKNSRSHTFTFDKVNPPSSVQADVFSDTQELITSVLDGYNVCIFAYGQTGSGKTYTMEGPRDNPGVNVRAVQHLFAEAETREDFVFRVSFSMLEIYNEQIRDLLDPENTESKLEVRQGENGNYVPGISEIEFSNAEDLLEAMSKAYENRCVGGTMMNEQSSRSHCVVTIRVDARSFSAGLHTRSTLNLVDLAGSERLSKSEASGDRLLETQAINKSLSALGDVICASKAQKRHIPFRNSKLTYLLQDSLGGNSKTMMFVNISPSDVHAHESICSLKFANRVHQVELGKAQKNKAVHRTSSQ